MVKLAALVLVYALTSGAAVAQSPQIPQSPSPAPSSLTNDPSGPPGPDLTNANPAAPLSGANSFTADQARDRLAANGFSRIGRLVKDDDGIWRGKADKAGKTFSVAVDFQGNVVAK
jgi:putative membrane protein